MFLGKLHVQTFYHLFKYFFLGKRDSRFAPDNEFHNTSKPDAAQAFIMKERFVSLYHPFDSYKFPKRIFRKAERPWQSSWFKAYEWLYRVTNSDAMIFYICVNQDLNGYLRSEAGGGHRSLSGYLGWGEEIWWLEIGRG